MPTETSESAGTTETEQQTDDAVYDAPPWPSTYGDAALRRYTEQGNGPGPEYQERWSTLVDSPVTETTPLVTRNYVIVFDTNGTIYGLDPQNGEISWQNDVGLTPNREPFFHDGVIALSTGDRIIGISTADGTRTWEKSIEVPNSPDELTEVYDTPRTTEVIATDGIVVFGVVGTHSLYGLDIADGTTVWERELDPIVTDMPAAKDGRVIVPAYYGSTPDEGAAGYMTCDLETGQTDWSLETPFVESEQQTPFGDEFATARSPIISDDIIGIRKIRGQPLSILSLFTPETGEITAQVISDEIGGVAGAQGTDLYVNVDPVTAARISIETFTEAGPSAEGFDGSHIDDIGRFRIDALTDEYLYDEARTSSQFRVATRETNEVTSTNNSQWEWTRPAIAGESFFVGTERGEVRAFESA